MNLKKVISEDVIRVPLASTAKDAVIEELLDILVSTGRVKDRARALKAIVDREAKMSTGMQGGLALPHAKTDAVDRLVVSFGTKPEGIEFQSLDGRPATMFVMTLSPLNRAGTHIKFLAEIGRFLSDPETRRKVLEAKTPADVSALLS